jgi:tetratricopeptide (TPR) repeat protein
MKETENPKADELIDDCDSKLATCPDDVDALCLRGWCWLRKKCPDKAIEDFDKALSLDGKRVDALHNRGRAYSEKEDYDEAIADFDSAFHYSPTAEELVHLYHNRGIAYFHNGDALDAIENFHEAISRKPDHTRALRMRGLSWFRLEDYQQAFNDFDHAIEIESGNADAYHNRGNCCIELGRFRRAVADFTHAILLDPDHPKVARTYASRGMGWRHRGRYDRALADYERALELEPNSSERRWTLGGFLACCPNANFRDGERAVELLTEACELTHYGKAKYVNILAAAHAAKGDFQKAITVSERVFDVATDESDREDAEFARELFEAGELWLMDKPTFWDRWK